MKKLIYNQVLSKPQMVGKVNCAAMQFVCYFLTAILLTLFMPASLAQSYTYNPSLQTYTECGSGYYESFAMSYSNCWASGGTCMYEQGHVCAALWSRSSSTGTLTFRVAKCNGYYVNGNTGKVLILDNHSGDVYCTDFHIYDDYTPHVQAKIFNYGDFTGRRTFDLFLITEDQVYKFYAGRITIQAGGAPISNVYEPTNVTAYSATLNGCVNPNGDETDYAFSYGTTLDCTQYTSLETLPAGNDCEDVSADITGLNPETTYYFRIVASNSSGGANSTNIVSFTTLAEGSAPSSTTLEAANVEAGSARLRGRVNPQGRTTYYRFEYGVSTNYGNQTVTGTLPGDYDNHTVYVDVTGLQPNTTYYYRLYAYNDRGEDYGSRKQFTTDADGCYFPDCTSATNCGSTNYASSIYTAAQYLCDHNIVTGDGNTGYLNPDQNITRGQLAIIALYGLYNGEENVPNPLVSDYFPVVYSDLQNTQTYYHRAAKALMYIEYQDGVSPFDRDHTCFNPEGNIQRCFVLKVLLETFNIAPLTSGTNVFDDFGPSGYENSAFWGYAQKAYNLNIVQTTHFRPDDYCTRGEAFLFLYRIMTNVNITQPTPVNSNDPTTSSFFIPSNLSLETMAAMRGVEYGNFNYYEKDFFDIKGYANLCFGVNYNSYLTEMPADFYPIEPLGKAWGHNWNMFMNPIHDSYNNSTYYLFHMQGGSILVYDNALQSVTEGNYYTLSMSNSKYILRSTNQIVYTFERFSTSDGIYYLTEVKDRNNNTVSLTYENGINHYRVSSVTTMGRSLYFVYHSNSDLLSYVQDPSNRRVRFYFDSEGQLNSLKDAKNQETHFSYGTYDFEKGLLKEITFARGNHVYNNYQMRKLVSSRVNTSIPTTVNLSTNYQNGTMASTVTQPISGSQSHTTQYTMDAQGRITRVNDNVSTDVSYAYNNSQHPMLISSSTDNKLNIQSTYSYTSKGLLSGATHTAGGQTLSVTFSYNSTNDLTSYTDALGNTTHLHYTNGNLTSVVDPLGNTTSITNNSHGKPVSVTTPMGVVSNLSYNSYGNLVSMSVPSLNLTRNYTYDALSRLTMASDFSGSTVSYTWDDNDNILQVVDALNNTLNCIYDANDNLITITNALGRPTNITYDNNDFVSSVSFEGSTKSYTYNSDGSLKKYTKPDGQEMSYTYNNAGDITSDGYATYGYDNRGLLQSVTKDAKSISYTYDAWGRISTVSYDGKTIGYGYDNNSNIVSVTYPGNKTVQYTYDACDRMVTAQDWNGGTTTYHYRNDSRMDFYVYPNGVKTNYTYDNAGRLIGLSMVRNNGSGMVVASYDFSLDNVGNHLQEMMVEPFATYPDISSSTTNYNYNNANQLLSAGSMTFSYDANGNTTARAGRTMSYDARNMLTQVSGDFQASYTYDGLGFRRLATRNGETRKYVVDVLNDRILMETDGAGTPLFYYVYGASGLISRISASNETLYYCFDYRGSTIAMVDATSSANITHQYQYNDFGVLQSNEADMNRFRFGGRDGLMWETDGLVYVRARYYDEETGRFITQDPIWAQNLYPYAGSDPINKIDPTGMLEELAMETPGQAAKGPSSFGGGQCSKAAIVELFKEELFWALKGHPNIKQHRETVKQLQEVLNDCKKDNKTKTPNNGGGQSMNWEERTYERELQKLVDEKEADGLKNKLFEFNHSSKTIDREKTEDILIIAGFGIVIVAVAIFAPEALPCLLVI